MPGREGRTASQQPCLLYTSVEAGQISIDVGMPIGSEMEETAAIEDRIVRIVEDTVPELDTLYYSTGASSSLMSSGKMCIRDRY